MDKLTTTSDIINIPASVILMNFKANGRGMCIGGLSSENDALEIKLKTYMTGGIQPITIQEGGLNFNDFKTSGYYSGKIETKNAFKLFKYKNSIIYRIVGDFLNEMLCNLLMPFSFYFIVKKIIKLKNIKNL